MSGPQFKTFEPKVASLEEVKLEFRSTTCERDVGTADDGAGLDGKPVLRHPNPLPCTIIFIHGVNSEGEWYNQAEDLLCRGLNDRLGRWGSTVELKTGIHPRDDTAYNYSTDAPLKSTRPDFREQSASNTNYLTSKSPVIRFYWGFKARKGDAKRPSHQDINDRPGTDAAHRRQYPVSLDEDDCWGGGPFQNGTLGLWQMFRKDKGFTLDFQRANPITDRYLTEAPPRTYYVHAARRLAFLISTIREHSPQETINIVSHSQGTMVAMLCALMLKERGVRGPEALFVCNSPYSLNPPGGLLEIAQFGKPYVVSQKARSKTLKAVADVIQHAGNSGEAFTDDQIKEQRLCRPERKADVTRAEYGRLYVYANPHDRVMGASVLRSIGWRGLTDSEKSSVKAENLYVRMFAENIEVGKGGYSYTMSAAKFGITKDDKGQDLGTDSMGQPKIRTDFWYPVSEKVMSVYGIYSPPTAQEATITINAPTVPWLTNGSLREEMKDAKHDWAAFQTWDGHLKDFDQRAEKMNPKKKGADARDVAAYRQVYHPNYEVVRMEKDPYGKDYPVFKTAVAASDDMAANEHNLTDHSTLPQDEFVVRGVMAWDLALGLNQSYTDVAYWGYLKALADWKTSDPYFLENDEGLQPEPGDAPPGVETELAYPNERDLSLQTR